MIKGPLVWAVVALAIILMVISAIMILDRDLFLNNSTLIASVSGAVALVVIVLLILMLFRVKRISD